MQVDGPPESVIVVFYGEGKPILLGAVDWCALPSKAPIAGLRAWAESKKTRGARSGTPRLEFCRNDSSAPGAGRFDLLLDLVEIE